MSPATHAFIVADLVPLLAAALAALACALLGSLLLLRKLSMMGDAISHSVLPGLVAAFILTGSRAPLPVLLGAAAAGLAAALLVEALKRARVEPGTAMGAVFSVMFALGVLLIERTPHGRGVDLDPSCVLYGQLEFLIWWDAPSQWADLLAPRTLATLPAPIFTVLLVAIATIAGVALLFKELRLVAFDPALAGSLGFRPGVLHVALLGMTSLATVAAFEAVGSILVIALLVGPAAAARLLTDRFSLQLILSAIIGVGCAIAGYALATRGVIALGQPRALPASGMIAVVCGLAVLIAAIASPAHGIVPRALRQRALARRVALEDLLGLLHRAEEHDAPAPTRAAVIASLGATANRASRDALAAGLIAQRDAQPGPATLALTDAGRAEAAALIRRHRLWERYLVDAADLDPQHVHDPAERLEHARRPSGEPITPPPAALDPHGRPIPPVVPPAAR